MNQRSHLVVAKKYQRVVKRGSTNNLHHLSSLQQSSSRGRLSDRGSAESKRQKKKSYKRSRFQWISILRQEIMKRPITISKHPGQLSLKDAVSAIQPYKWIQSQNQTTIQEQMDSDEVIKLLKKSQKAKITIDQIIFILAPIIPENRVSNCIRQKHGSCNQIVQPTENDPQTARFNDNCPNVQPFIESHMTIQSQTRLRSLPDEHQQLSLFDHYLKSSCENLKILSKKSSMSRIQRQMLNQLLDYGMYSRNGQMFCGVKLSQIQAGDKLNKLLCSMQIKQFLSYIQALRVSKSLFNSYQFLIQEGLKILNLCDNNLTNINFLSSCVQLQFLNVNHNQLKTLDPVREHERLVEIHCLNNYIQVPLSRAPKFKKLQILDLGYNQIIDCKSLQEVSVVKSLRLLNLMANPVLQSKVNSKRELGVLFGQLKCFVYPEVYILSEFSVFKDITFYANEEKSSKEDVPAPKQVY